tara:strand:+ start:5371 stop:6198 length:828 start_codon:yes stop_codon:yes gene_type:complete
MQIREFAKPVTSKSLNESLAARFGKKINLDSFTLEQLQDVRNKIRTKLFNVETMESFDSVQNDTYQKSKMMLDVLNAAISERGDIDDDNLDESVVNEGAEDQAELVMAAKEMVDRVTGWMEDTAEMQTESMLELADAIRDEMGQEAADAFTSSVKPSLDSLFGALEVTRAALTQGVGQLTGEGGDMGAMGADGMDDGMDDMGDMEPTMDGDMDMDSEMPADDDFGSAAAATGGEEPADRAKRESIERKTKSVLSKMATKESMDPRKLASTLSKKK